MIKICKYQIPAVSLYQQKGINKKEQTKHLTTMKNAYQIAKEAIVSGKARRLFDMIDYNIDGANEVEYSLPGEVIFELVAKHGEGLW